MTAPMQGQVALLTGSTSGIGAAAARELAARGATVVLHGRDQTRGEEVRRRIAQATGNADVHLMTADFADLAQVRDLADAVRERFGRLDALVNNAGMFVGRRTTTVDGLEMTFAVNHLGPFLLTTRLLDLLKASAPSRIVTVASEAHRMGRLDFDDLHSERGYNEWRVYGASKRANILFTVELARRLEGTGVTAVAMHPGTVRTRLDRRGSVVMRLLWWIGKPFMRSARRAGRDLAHLVVGPEVEAASGRYFNRRRLAVPAPEAADSETARRLWAVSEALTGRVGG